MADESEFTFEISLSVLDHLGRNLYRSFTTVLGEAISNSWDADAENVWIYVDKDKGELIIKDDGTGMSKEDFQEKFLKIGYSKRKYGQTKTEGKGRPLIGRKGIGKLALLSCAKKISILSKRKGGSYVGGSIDNKGLDKAITEDLNPSDYPLGKANSTDFDPYTEGHEHGTIIIFQGVKEGIKHSLDFLRKNVALYFRFSLIDPSFSIFLNDDEITLDDLKDLAGNTQFLWKINEFDDPFIDDHLTDLLEKKILKATGNIRGFIASVRKPRNLKIFTTEERVSIDLFVNGRLREKDILRHVPTARVVENYLYGQIHFNELDGKKTDRFTSSREGIVANDPVFTELLNTLSKEVLNKVFKIWDEWRVKHKETGDEENPRLTRRERKSGELFFAVAEDYEQEKDSPTKEKVGKWIDELAGDASFNFASYADCFISENLVRKYIEEKNVLEEADPKKIKDALGEIEKWKTSEEKNKEKGNLSIELRQNDNDLSYLSMDGLAALVDKKDPIIEACLTRDAKEYKPIRDALAHTALLTAAAKGKLITVYENIRGRIQSLLSQKD